MKAPKRMDYCIDIPGDRGKRYEIFRYPAGEAQVRLPDVEVTLAAQADCIKVTANIRDGEVMELALLTSALNDAAKYSTKPCRAYRQLILPYLPYSRADRVFKPGDCSGLETFAKVINSLEYDHVITWDAHSSAAEKFIRRLVVMSSGELIAKAVKKIGRKDLLILLPDNGAKRYEDIVKNLGLEYIYGLKVRDGKTGKLSGFKVPLPSKFYKKILIIDDICDGGRTFVGLAEAIDELIYPAVNNRPSILRDNAKAPELYLFVTHGIFSKGLAELAKYFKKIYTSDSFDPFKEETVYNQVQKQFNLVEIIKY